MCGRRFRIKFITQANPNREEELVRFVIIKISDASWKSSCRPYAPTRLKRQHHPAGERNVWKVGKWKVDGQDNILWDENKRKW